MCSSAGRGYEGASVSKFDLDVGKSCAVMCLLACVLGIGAYRVTLSQADTELANTVVQLDSLFGEAERMSELVPAPPPPCAHLATRLRELTARHSAIRSLNIAEGGTVTCSSIYGDSREPVSFSDYADETLALMPGNALTPGHPLIVLRSRGEGFSVLAGIDSAALRNTLSGHADLRLVIGRIWLDAKGAVHSVAGAGSLPTKASYRFPYAVKTDLSFRHFWLGMSDLFWSPWVIVLLTGLICSAFVSHRLQSQWPETRLRRALYNGEFVPYLQPVMGPSGEYVGGCEVLMRWLHPEKGLIQPDYFIPQAETSGLIVPMTRVLMQQVQQRFGPLSGSLPAGFHFAFNISASHCRDLSLVEDCRAFLASFADQPVKLVLELTERELVVPDATTLQLFAELKALGVGIAVDDFGTGHASLSYLQQFDVDTLKIDRSFVAQLGRDALSTHIVDNVLDLAKRLDLRVVAEGVESPEQRDCLVKRGVDFLQGYLFGKPVPIEDFIRECGYQS